MKDYRCPCGTKNEYINHTMGSPFISCMGCGVKQSLEMALAK